MVLSIYSRSWLNDWLKELKKTGKKDTHIYLMSSIYILHHMVESYRYYERGMAFRGEGSTSRNKVLKFCEGRGGVYAKPWKMTRKESKIECKHEQRHRLHGWLFNKCPFSISSVPGTVRAMRVLNCSPRIYSPKKESGGPMSVWVSVRLCVYWYRLGKDRGTGLRGGSRGLADQEHSKDLNFQITLGLYSSPA